MVFVATCCYYQSKHSILEFSYMIRTLNSSQLFDFKARFGCFVFACIGVWCVPCTLLPLVLTSIQIKLPTFRKSQQQAYKKVNKYLKEASTVAFPLPTGCWEAWQQSPFIIHEYCSLLVVADTTIRSHKTLAYSSGSLDFVVLYWGCLLFLGVSK
jgi:hypothetical protein